MKKVLFTLSNKKKIIASCATEYGPFFAKVY